MVIEIAESLGKQLHGRVQGKKHFAEVCAKLAGSTTGEVVVLDFDRVEIVTGSWVNAMIVPLFRWACDEQTDLYPVLSNVSNGWLDELELVAGWNHQCYLISEGRQAQPRRASLIGKLDPAQRATLDTVLELGTATGAALAKKLPNQAVKATAWNNRLKELCLKRLLRREKKGREQIYSPVIKEIVCDG